MYLESGRERSASLAELLLLLTIGRRLTLSSCLVDCAEKVRQVKPAASGCRARPVDLVSDASRSLNRATRNRPRKKGGDGEDTRTEEDERGEEASRAKIRGD